MLTKQAILGGLLTWGLLHLGAAHNFVRAVEPNAKTSTSDGTFVNPGVYRQVVNGLLYEWIPTEVVNFQIQGNGAVRMIAPATKLSLDGQTDCQRFVYDHLHRRLDAAEENALLGKGLLLPPGNYGFAIQWVNAKSYDEVRARPWDLTCNPETYKKNSGQLDYLYLSIVPAHASGTKSSTTEVALPRDLQRVSWLPHYQVLPDDLRLPADKGFGVTRVLWDLSFDQLYKKVTHIQYSYHELDDVSPAKKWKTKQALNHKGELASNQWLIDDHPMDRNFITASEMDENFGVRGVKDHSQRAQQIFQGIYGRMQRELGVTSPSQTRLYDDYFSALEGFDNRVSFIWTFNAPQLREGLANQQMARRMHHDGQWSHESRYFADKAYEYRNWMQGGYLDSFPVCPEGVRVYNEIYNYERKFMAIPDRRVAKFGWSNGEGVNSNMYRHGVKSRLHFPEGDIIRTDVVAWPFHTMLNESFWALLLGNDYVLWHSSVRLVQDPLTFGDSWAADAGKTQWQPSGGSIVEFNEQDPSHPQRKKSPQGQFPNNPHLGESGAFAGAWLVGQITEVSDRTSKSIAYSPFEYHVNGGNVENSYAKSNRPENDELGNAELSRYGVANYGQANIVDTFAAKKPICVYTEGKDGAALIFHHVYGRLTDRIEVTITTKTGPRTVSIVGNDLHVVLLD